jgi:predicted secreted protein
MTRTHTTRTIIRRTFAAGVILLAWYTATQISENSPTSVPLTLITVALLACVYRALRPKAN